MRKILLSISILSFSLAAASQYRIRLDLIHLPSNHPPQSGIYIAGPFNGWNPADTAYRFQLDEWGHYFLVLQLEPGNYPFKLTRGSWEKVECREDGQPIDNKLLPADGRNEFSLAVEGWQDLFPALPRQSTASPRVQLLDTAFPMRRLDRHRRIWVYLPEEYGRDPRRRWPVLYMQDGQNLFDQSRSFAGEWGVDEYFDSSTFAQCIVVGIEHAGSKRLNEYNPYDHEKFGEGEGDRYARFIVKELKPFIDRKYRTYRNRKHRFIAGSSMGGLISLYATLKYPSAFGGAMVFSPAFQTSPPIYGYIKKRGTKLRAPVFFYAGKQEGEPMLTNTLKAFEILASVSRSPAHVLIRHEGRHNEASWRQEFPAAWEWLIHNRD